MRVFLTIAALFLFTAPAHAECHQVEFQRGAYSAEVTGHAYHAVTDCFILEVRPGQAARVRVIYGPNVVFDVPGIGNAYTDMQFYTQTRRLDVYVYQLKPANGGQPYRLKFEIV